VTTGVGADRAEALPTEFVAVTTTRIVEPASPAVTTCVPPVAPGRSTQLVPAAEQRCQWNAKPVGLPFQAPVEAVRVWPISAVPVIVGRVVFAGTSTAWTTAVGADAAVAEPTAFCAVTLTRSVEPASAPVTTYVGFVAPGIATQGAPAESHRSHWAAKVGGAPAHVPVVAVSV